MADIQLHTNTQDIEITAPQTKDVVIGSPMDKGGVLPITKNGKYVVSDYDLAEVEVQPAVSEIQVTENGTYLPKDYDVDAFSKVEVQVDDTRRVMAEFINNGGTLAYYNGAKMPDIDWNKVTRTNWGNLFAAGKISLHNVSTDKVTSMVNWLNEANVLDEEIYLDFPNATSINYCISYFSTKSKVKKITVRAPKATTAQNNCNRIESLEEFNLLDTDRITTINYSFTSCPNLKRISAIQCGALNTLSLVFNGSQPALEDFGGFIDIGKSIKNYTAYPLTVKNAPKLTHQSLMNIINGLYDISDRNITWLILQLGETNYAKLTDDDIKIATDKGWTVTQ